MMERHSIQSTWKFIACVCILFFAVTFLVYSGSLHNQFVSWDDLSLIPDNHNVTVPGFLAVKNVFTSYDPELYVPLTFLTFQFDWITGGGDPLTFHLTALFLHTVSSLLVAWILFLLLRRRWLAVALGLVFALHPLNVETVAWASARKDVLSACFFFVSLGSYLHWRDTGRRGWYVSSLILFLLALLSKVVVVMLPVVFLLIEWMSDQSNDRLQANSYKLKARLADLIPYLLLALLFGLIALFGKRTVLGSSSPVSMILVAGYSTMFYLWKFLIPTGLAALYPWVKPITIIQPIFLIPLILSAVFLLVAISLRRRSRLASFGMLYYLVTLIPSFTTYIKGDAIYLASDRYAYIPMLGLLLAVGVLLSRWLDRSVTDREISWKSRTLTGAFIIVAALAGFASQAQSMTWLGNRSLYAHVLSLYPDAWTAHNNLGMDLKQVRLYDDAIREFNTALAIKEQPTVLVNLGATYVEQGKDAEATKAFERAIQVMPSLPHSYIGLGNLARRRGDLTEAIRQYRVALDKAPDSTMALNNLGGVLIEREQWEDAIGVLKRSLRYDPLFAESWYNLAGAYQQTGRLAEAEDAYRQALSIEPKEPDAIAGLATVLYDLHRIPEAAKELEKALALSPDNPTAVSLALRMQKDGMASVKGE